MKHYPTVGDQVRYIQGFDGNPSDTVWIIKRFEMHGMALIESNDNGQSLVSVDSLVFADSLKYEVDHCPACTCSRCKDVNDTEESDAYDRSNCHQK